jgi:hypothetical protein
MWLSSYRFIDLHTHLLHEWNCCVRYALEFVFIAFGFDWRKIRPHMPTRSLQYSIDFLFIGVYGLVVVM